MIVLILLLIVTLIYCIYKTQYVENMINIQKIKTPKWNRNKCIYTMGETLKNVLNDYKIVQNDQNDWQLYFPCTYDEIDKEIDMIQLNNKQNTRIFVIQNADAITSKDDLWNNIVQYHGLEKAKTMMPTTYILYNDTDIQKVKKEFDPKKLYILKKNIQRQEGLKITDSLDDILNAKKENYVIAQELLQNPYTIGNRKINMRFYVLVMCNKGNVDIYVYNNGFMYYTKEPFKKHSKEFGPNITTGYIDRWIYDINPLTHEDFKIYLDANRQLSYSEQTLKKYGRLSQIVFNRIYDLLRNTFISTISKICTSKKLYESITFQLFGVDVAIDNNLWPMIMECNKGPDMGAKDERDKKVKYNCMKDILKIVGVIDEPNNGFIKIYEH